MLGKEKVIIMLDSRKALIPGSFDPPTLGHYDLAARASQIFDEVYVVEFVNSSKTSFFSADQRLQMLNAAFADMPNVRVDMCSGLLAQYCLDHNIGTIVKGARSSTDFDYELSLSLINRSIIKELDTVILPTRSELMHVSSTMVRELIRYSRDYSACVPASVAALVAEFKKN